MVPPDLYNARFIEKLKKIDSVIFFSSKYFQLSEAFWQVAYHELSPASVAKSITSILCPNDFEYPYYRAATLLTIVFVAQLDIRYNHPIETTPIEDLFDYQSITFAVTEKNQIIIEGETVSNQELKTILMDFIRKNESNHIILFQSDRGTSYAFYVEVHNQITSAYNDLRNDLAIKRFNKPFNELKGIQQKELEIIYPVRVRESEKTMP
jgi:biopolymer transport protein ExbD